MFFGIFLCVCLMNTGVLAWTSQNTSGCFGIGSEEDFLLIHCPLGGLVYLEQFFTGAKLKSLNCPAESTSQNRNVSKCCTHSEEDCLLPFDAKKTGIYKNCTGHNSCRFRVDRSAVELPCRTLLYDAFTHYMLVEYVCIPGSSVLDVGENDTLTGSDLYIHSENYPSPVQPSENQLCSVSSPCGTTIQLTALDLRLQFNGGGGCAQLINIDDDDNRTLISCSANNDFVLRTVYQSYGPFVIIYFNNAQQYEGYFWIRINATDDQDKLEVACGSSALADPGPNHVCTTPSATSTTSSVVPPSPKYVSSTGEVSKPPERSGLLVTQVPAGKSGMHPGTITAIAVVGVCLLALVIVLLVYWKKKKKSEGGKTVVPRMNGRRYAPCCTCLKQSDDMTWASRRETPGLSIPPSEKHRPNTSEQAPSLFQLDRLPFPQKRTELPSLGEIHVPTIMQDQSAENFKNQVAPLSTDGSSAPRLPPIVTNSSWV